MFVRVLRTRNDTGVPQTLSMESSKIGMVVGKHSTMVGGTRFQQDRIGNPQKNLAGFSDRLHVMPEAA